MLTRAWIGLAREETNKNNWQWLDGVSEPNNSSFWREGEPNNIENGEDCAVIITGGAKLNDLPCSWNIKGLCEISGSEC